MKQIIHTNEAPKAVGPYSQAVKHGETLYLAGQIALDPQTGQLNNADIAAETNQIMKNIGGVLKEAGLDYSNILTSTVLLTDINDYSAVNEVYAKFLTEPYPARAAFAVKELPAGAKVEIQVIAGY